jgi:hypothetical protein
MALKGKTTFELTNVETGEVRKIEDNNMVTKAFEYLFRLNFVESTGNLWFKALGTELDNYDNTSVEHDKVMKMFTGGLVLFDSPLDEDVENIFPPSGVETTGCGATKAYTGLNTMAGSYNVAESGVIENGYKHVWDFGTSQGNGQIACACLTTRNGGHEGCGTFPFDKEYQLSNYSSRDGQLGFNSNLGYVSYSINTQDSTGSRSPKSVSYLYADAEKNFVIQPYRFTDVENFNWMPRQGKIELEVIRFPFTDFSIFDYRTTGNALRRVIKKVDVEMPSELKAFVDAQVAYYSSANFQYGFSNDEGFIYIWMYRQPNITNNPNHINAGETIYIWKINVEDFSSSLIKVVNTTGQQLYCPSYFDYCSEVIKVTNNYLLAIGLDGCIYKFDLNNSTNVSKIVYPDETEVIMTNTNNTYNFIGDRPCFGNGYVIKNKLYFLMKGVPVVIDLATNKLSYRHINPREEAYNIQEGTQYVAYTVPVRHSGGLLFTFAYSYKSGSSGGYYRYTWVRKFTNLLLTINNLLTPVVKTSAETMKVTYTLVEEAEEE